MLTTGAVAETPLERGAYLVKTIGACGNCHTPKGARGVPIADKEMAGGFKFDEKPFIAYASNITPDPETGIGKWTVEQIAASIKSMTRPDGSIIQGPMQFYLAGWSTIEDRDLQSIAAYVKQIPAMTNKVPKSTFKATVPMGPPGAGSASGSAH
jgi:mono/diheme cytochrome c family protein